MQVIYSSQELYRMDCIHLNMCETVSWCRSIAEANHTHGDAAVIDYQLPS